MKYLKIRNWDKWQTYRVDRGQPPWIKVHRRLLRDPEWVSLSDAEKGQLVSMWLLAADKEGLIPADPLVIQKLCFMTKPPNLNNFSKLGFIESDGCQGDAKVTPERRQDDDKVTHQSRVEKSRVEKSREDKTPHGEFRNVLLTSGERKKLFEKFGQGLALQKIEKLSGYIASKGASYKSHYATILNWDRKDRESNPASFASFGDNPRQDPHFCQICKKKKSVMKKPGLCLDCDQGQVGEAKTPIPIRSAERLASRIGKSIDGPADDEAGRERILEQAKELNEPRP